MIVTRQRERISVGLLNLTLSRGSLTKDPRSRPGPQRMLQHPFIRMWEDVEIDLSSWIKEVWNWA